MTSGSVTFGMRGTQRRHDLWGTVRHVIDRLAHRTLNVDFSRMLWLDAERLALPAADQSVAEFHFLAPDEVGRLAADPDNHLNPAMADPAFSGGGLCLAALVRGRVAAYGWFALGEVDPRHCGGVSLSLPPEVAYFYNGFTHPHFRGRGLYGQLMSRGLRALMNRGVRHLVASVAWSERAGTAELPASGLHRFGRLSGDRSRPVATGLSAPRRPPLRDRLLRLSCLSGRGQGVTAAAASLSVSTKFVWIAWNFDSAARKFVTSRGSKCVPPACTMNSRARSWDTAAL